MKRDPHKSPHQCSLARLYQSGIGTDVIFLKYTSNSDLEHVYHYAS